MIKFKPYVHFVVGAVIAFSIAKLLVGADFHIKFSVVSFFVFFSAYFYLKVNMRNRLIQLKEINEKYGNAFRLAPDDILNKTINQLSIMIFKGADKNASEAFLGELGIPENLHSEMHRRALVAAKPPYKKTEKYGVSLINSAVGFFLLIASSLLLGFGFASSINWLIVLSFGVWWICDDFMTKKVTLHDYDLQSVFIPVVRMAREKGDKFKVFLVKYLLEAGVLRNCSGLVVGRIKVFFADDYKVTSDRSEQGAFHVVLNNKGGVSTHRYSPDPRESYERKDFDDFGSFYFDYVSSRIEGGRAIECAKYPEVISAYVESHNSELDSEVRVERMLEFSDITEKNRAELRLYCEDLTRQYMKSAKYRLLSLFV